MHILIQAERFSGTTWQDSSIRTLLDIGFGLRKEKEDIEATFNGEKTGPKSLRSEGTVFTGSSILM